MEHETIDQQVEQTTDQYDAFFAGFDGDEPSVMEEQADQPADTVEEEAEQEETTETTEEESANATAESDNDQQAQSETTEEAPAAEAAEKQTPASWVIKHMGEEKTVNSADITPELLQKGFDYDRIRSKYDEAKPVMEIFSDLAKKAGVSVAEYAKTLRVEMKKASGQSEAEAKRTVELEDREAAIAAQEAQRQEEANAKQSRQDKLKADLADFQKAFPDIYEKAKTDPNVIPKSVYEDVGRGFSLTAAYGRYVATVAQANAKAAQEKAAVAAQGQKNATRATGSMKSAGNESKNKDAFLDGFGD